MNNITGIISKAQDKFNRELKTCDLENGSNEAVSFYGQARARIAQVKREEESLKYTEDKSKIVTGEELRHFFDRDYDIEDSSKRTKDDSERDER